MGHKIIKISPEIILQFITSGNAWGIDEVIRVKEGIPPGTKIIRCRYSMEIQGDPVLILLLEHESWPEVAEGEQYPVFVPSLERIKIENSLTALPYERLDPKYRLL